MFIDFNIIVGNSILTNSFSYLVSLQSCPKSHTQISLFFKFVNALSVQTMQSSIWIFHLYFVQGVFWHPTLKKGCDQVTGSNTNGGQSTFKRKWITVCATAAVYMLLLWLWVGKVNKYILGFLIITLASDFYVAPNTSALRTLPICWHDQVTRATLVTCFATLHIQEKLISSLFNI